MSHFTDEKTKAQRQKLAQSYATGNWHEDDLTQVCLTPVLVLFITKIHFISRIYLYS